MNRTIAFLLGVVLVAGCSGEDTDQVEPHAVHWGYEGNEGPEHWAALSSDYAICAEGAEQSPIDLTDAQPAENLGLERRLGVSVLSESARARVADIVDNGHTIQVSTDVPLSLLIGDDTYEMVQFHFHAPSEHTIDGEHAPLEAHFVHKSAAGELAVVGVLLEEGEHMDILDPIVASLPNGQSDPRHLEDVDIDVNNLRQFSLRYFTYQGSLTTPPCSEGVRWIVARDRRQMSPEQLAAFVSRLSKNNRPVQALGERGIGLVTE